MCLEAPFQQRQSRLKEPSVRIFVTKLRSYQGDENIDSCLILRSYIKKEEREQKQNDTVEKKEQRMRKEKKMSR